MSATFSRTNRFLNADRSTRRLVTILVVLLLAAWTAWFVLGRVTVHEVTAKARLEAQSAAHAIAAPVAGQVVETRLTIGREVQAGEVLVVLDSAAERHALEQKRARHTFLGKRLAALRAEIDAEQTAMAVQCKARNIAQEEAKAAVAEAKIQAGFAQDQSEMLAKLGSKRAASDEDVRKGRAALEGSQAAVSKLTLTTARLEQDCLVQESDRKVRLAKLQSEAVALEGEAVVEKAAVAMLEQTIELRVIRAPVSGKVGEVAEVRVGSVVRAAEKLGAIIPPGAARAVALFPVAAIGRIQPGQTARLRLDGFPWTQYGTLKATVTHVGNEGSSGLIRVEMTLVADPESLIPLGHGLPGTAEVEVETVSPAEMVLRASGQFLAAGGNGKE